MTTYSGIYSGTYVFQDKLKHKIPGASIAEMKKLRSILAEDFGVSPLQVVESVAYSMAMVVRVALGLSADQASVGVLYTDSLSGWIALASARHLMNAGCKTHLVDCQDTVAPSQTLTQLKRPLQRLGVNQETFENLRARREIKPFLGACHNVLCGIAPDSHFSRQEQCNLIIRTLNENSIPVHAIDAPLGVNLDSGEIGEYPLYASSTLSLGVPYRGLDEGSSLVGRHYLADISLPFSLVSEILNHPYPPLFSEQPVVQIFPEKIEEEA